MAKTAAAAAIAGIVLGLVPGLANAQQIGPPQASPEAESLALAYRQMGLAINGLVKEQALAGAEFRRQLGDAEARLKWVLDNWVPGAGLGPGAKK
jgi:hypothetical protein